MIGLLKSSLLRDSPLGMYLAIINPSEVNADGVAGSAAGGSQFADLKPRMTPKKNPRNPKGHTPHRPGTESSPTAPSPSLARATRIQKGGFSAQKLQKGRLDALLGIEFSTSSGGSTVVGRSQVSPLADVVDPDTALQLRITGDPLRGEDSPVDFYEAPLPSQAQDAAGGGKGRESDMIGKSFGFGVVLGLQKRL